MEETLYDSAAKAEPARKRARPRIRYFSPWLVVLTAVWLVIYVRFFPTPGALAAKNWPLVLIGVAGATIGNLTAIGGGLVFVPTKRDDAPFSCNRLASNEIAFTLSRPPIACPA